MKLVKITNGYQTQDGSVSLINHGVSCWYVEWMEKDICDAPCSYKRQVGSCKSGKALVAEIHGELAAGRSAGEYLRATGRY